MNHNLKVIQAVLLLSFTIVTIFGFDYLITNLDSTTGQATNPSGNVRIYINASNVTAEPDPVLNRSNVTTTGGGALGRPANIGLQISTHTQENIQALRISVTEDKPENIQLLLKNIGDITLNLQISETVPYMTIDKTDLHILPKKEGVITLTVLSKNTGVYTGLIYFTDRLKRVELPIIITVLPRERPYTLEVVIPEAFKTVQRGKELLSYISLEHLSKGELTLAYMIKDMQDTILLTEEETLPVEEQLHIDKTIKLPENAAVGDHVFIVSAHHKGKKLFAADSFSIIAGVVPREEVPQREQRPWLVIILLLVFLYAVAKVMLRLKKKKR